MRRSLLNIILSLPFAGYLIYLYLLKSYVISTNEVLCSTSVILHFTFRSYMSIFILIALGYLIFIYGISCIRNKKWVFGILSFILVIPFLFLPGHTIVRHEGIIREQFLSWKI